MGGAEHQVDGYVFVVSFCFEIGLGSSCPSKSLYRYYLSAMETKLCLADISTGEEAGLTVFEADHMFIGREPESGVCVLDEGISRRHGRFMRMGSHWFYQDVGSTNGSFINGREIEPGLWSLVRENDILQLADICLRVREVAQGSNRPLNLQQRMTRSRGLILILQGDSLIDQIAASEQGQLLTIGGPDARLMMGPIPKRFPALVVERVGADVVAYGADPDAKPRISGEAISGKFVLEDRCVITVGSYTVIYEQELESDSAAEQDSDMDWLAEKTKRTAPVRLVEVRAQRASTAHGLGRDLVPVGPSASVRTEPQSVAATQIVATKAIALVAGASTSTKLRSDSNTRSRSRSSQVDDEAILRSVDRIKSEIVDTFSVISGVISVFLIVGGLACLSVLLTGESLKEMSF